MGADYPRFVLHNLETGRRVGSVPVARGESLLTALLRTGLPIKTKCRGSLLCGQCSVVVVDEDTDGLGPIHEEERVRLEQSMVTDPRARLACQLELPAGRTSLAVATDYWE